MKYPSIAITDLEQLIDHCQPDTVLQVGKDEVGLANKYCEQREQILKPCTMHSVNANVSVADNTYMQRYDLAIVAFTLEEIDKVQGEQILSRLRDLCAPRIAVIVDFSKSSWNPRDLLAFGLVRIDHYSNASNEVDESLVGLYHYNIDTYKQTPDWLNSKDWANPELWDKVWW